MFVFRIDDEVELRMLDERWANELFALTDDCREHLREWLPWVDETQSTQDTLQFIRFTKRSWAEGKGVHCGIWDRGQLCGTIGMTGMGTDVRQAEIGYWLHPKFQGRGIVTRAARALIEYGFSQLKLNRIFIRCHPENTKSRAIAERLGFELEGTLRQAGWLYDHFIDLTVYGLLASQWRAETGAQ